MRLALRMPAPPPLLTVSEFPDTTVPFLVVPRTAT